MDWFKIINDYYKSNFYNLDDAKIFVVKGKITSTQFKEITGQDYIVDTQ